MLKLNILWKVLKMCTQECSNDDFGSILIFFMARSNLLWVEFMGFVEHFSAKVNKYS